MTSGNREVKALARTIQAERGITYTKALHEAECQVHLDLVEGNGPVSQEIAESWMPVLTRLKPTRTGQWVLQNYGPGWNTIKVTQGGFEDSYLVHVNPFPERDTRYVWDSEKAEIFYRSPVEDLEHDDVFELANCKLQDAAALHVIASANGVPSEGGPYDESTIEHLDLRQVEDDQQRINLIVEFLNGYAKRRPLKSV